MTGDYINQNSFAAGEIGPHLYGGVDHDFYQIGLRTCRNFIVKKYGGVSNRPGSKFISESKDNSKKSRTIEFQFNDTQTYVLELGNQYMRVIRNGGEVLNSGVSISAITQASVGVVTANAHGFSNGDDVYISGVVGMIELNQRTVRVANATTNTFEITDLDGVNINTTAYSAYISGGTVAEVFTVATPWLEADLFNLNFAQSNDTLTVVHPDYYMKDITRTADNAWTVTDFVLDQGPFKDINGTDTSVYASAFSGSGITLTASASLFTADDVGSLFYLEQNADDLTNVWEVQKGIRQSEIRRAGFHYYQAPSTAPTLRAITGVTAASPAIVTAPSHGLSDGDVIYIDGVKGMTEINEKFFTVGRVKDDTFALQSLGGTEFSTSGYTAFTLTGGATASISDITQADPAVVTATAHGFSDGDFIQISGVSGMTQVNGETFKIANTTTNTFELQTLNGTDIDSTGYTAYSSGGTATQIDSILETAYSTGTLKPDHTEGTQRDGDPGVAWTYLHSGFGLVEIVGYSSATSVTADVIKRLPDNLVGASGASINWAKAAFSVTEGYPSAVAYHKKRLMFAATVNQPSTLFMSGVGLRTYFGRNKPILDDDSIKISLDTTDKVQTIRHLVSLKKLVAFTANSEQVIKGDADGALLGSVPPNPDVESSNGSSKLRPIIINTEALYIDNEQSAVRNFKYEFASDGFNGIDLTVRSPHLFENRTIVDWAYQKTPLSIVWCVMSDGALLGLTYLPEQKVYAWHRHDTDGLYESVCCIKEGNETALYAKVKRTVDGVTKRYTERFASRYFSTIEDAFFVDSGLTYDGRNTGSITLTITGGTTWDLPESLTVTASSTLFTAADVGAEIHFVSGNITYRMEITAYTSSTVVTAIPTKQLASVYRNTARTDWRIAKKTFYGLDHLEGKAVSILGDGNVYDGLSVENGSITLQSACAVVHIGLPYTSDFETLDLAVPGGQLKAKTVNVSRVFLTVQESRDLFIATNGFDKDGNVRTNKFVQVKQREVSDGYDGPIPAKTGLVEVTPNSTWSNQGRFCIRQTNPLPLTINGMTLEGQGGYN
jgi:hypothetical protein